MGSQAELYLIADELRAIANAGLRWSASGYDQERYHQILKASARLVAALGDSPLEEILQQYNDNLAHLSPVLCVEAAVLRQGKILLIQRSDDRKWAVPGGVLEVGESLSQGVERELWEEAGLRGKATRLLALYDSRIWPGRSRLHLCTAQFLVEAQGEPGLHVVADALSPFKETLDVAFFAEDALPELSPGHERRIPMAFRLARGEVEPPYFD
jgi:ADP-ribose pyrophosphatase YjhB (NUDIX family)